MEEKDRGIQKGVDDHIFWSSQANWIGSIRCTMGKKMCSLYNWEKHIVTVGKKLLIKTQSIFLWDQYCFRPVQRTIVKGSFTKFDF